MKQAIAGVKEILKSDATTFEVTWESVRYLIHLLKLDHDREKYDKSGLYGE